MKDSTTSPAFRRGLSPWAALALPLLAACGLAACGQEAAPVGELVLEPAEIELPHRELREVELRWMPTAELTGFSGSPLVFLHLLNDAGEVLRTFDHPLPEAWTPEQEIRYPIRLFESALAPALPPGRYRLSAGLYDGDDRRWALRAGPKLGDQEYQVGIVRATAPRAQAPRFELSGEWLDPESGTDRQILVRRWLVGDGAIRILDRGEAGSVWVVLRWPPAGDPALRLVMDEGEDEPFVRLTVPCIGMERTFAAQSAPAHELQIDLPAVDGLEEPCAILLEANHAMVVEGSFERRVINLETLAWRSAS